MKLTWNLREVIRHANHARQSSHHAPSYGGGVATAGLFLVGDEGVYIMSNGKDEGRPPVSYARECNPLTMDFDDWWSVKRASFGADDGADPLDIDGIPKEEVDGQLEIEITEAELRITVVTEKAEAEASG